MYMRGDQEILISEEVNPESDLVFLHVFVDMLEYPDFDKDDMILLNEGEATVYVDNLVRCGFHVEDRWISENGQFVGKA